MTAQTLLHYFSGATGEQERQLLKQFDRLEAIKNLFYAIIIQEEGKYKLGYVSPSIETLTGHPIEKFSCHAGFKYFYIITPPEHRKRMHEQEWGYLNNARQIDFDPLKPFILELKGAFERADHLVVRVRLVAVVLKFTNMRTPKFSISTWQLTDGFDETQLWRFRVEIESTLRKIQKVFNQIFTIESSPLNKDEPAMFLYPMYDLEKITRQELRVLKLLSDGFSTKAIAADLNISINTTETHRRHLLQKFKANNVAELIKKATKVYWLE